MGVFMIFSHIKYGFEIFTVSIIIIITGLFIPSNSKIKKLIELENDKVNSFPYIMQSLGIVGGIILWMKLINELSGQFNNLIGNEASMLIVYLFAFGIPALVLYFFRKRRVKLKSPNLHNQNKIILFAVLGTISLLFGMIFPIAYSIPLPESIKIYFSSMAGQGGVLSLVLVVIVAPIIEEFIFRGVILNGLLKKYTPLISILISSALFAIVHLNPWQFVPALIAGIFIGWVFYKTKNLFLAIIIHASNNLINSLMWYFVDFNSFINKSLIENYGGLMNLTLSIVGSLIIFTISIYYLRIEFIKMKLKMAAHNKV